MKKESAWFVAVAISLAVELLLIKNLSNDSCMTEATELFAGIFITFCRCRPDRRAIQSNIQMCQCNRSITLEVQRCRERLPVNEITPWYTHGSLLPSEIQYVLNVIK